MNPRSVDGVVEKSRKSRLCGTKCCELRRDLGEGQKIATATISLERTCAHRNRLPVVCAKRKLAWIAGRIRPLVEVSETAPTAVPPPTAPLKVIVPPVPVRL